MLVPWYRLTCAAIAVVSVLATSQVDAVARGTGGSALTLLCTTFLWLLVVASGLLSLAPTALWTGIDCWRIRAVVHLRRTELPQAARSGRVLIACGVLAFLAIASWNLMHPDEIGDDDQLAFLQTASEVHAAGGPLTLVRNLYSGTFLEANRHPLYIGLLSLSPTEWFGRRLSFVIGLSTLCVLTWLVHRLHGPLIAGVFCLLLGTNESFCLFSTRVVCEVLMVLWCGLAFLMVSRRPSGNPRRQLLLGAVLGLAYLTKGTGLLLFLGYIIWLGCLAMRIVGRHRTGGTQQSRETTSEVASSPLVLLAWLVVISPLVVRNIQIQQSPFYNINSYLLFVDAYEDPQTLSERSSVAGAAKEYLQTHTLGEMVRRELSGLVWETFIMLRLLGPASLDDARVLFGLPLAVCALVAVVADPRREQLLLGIWIIVCVPLFAWYMPVAAGERFPLPLLVPILVLSAGGIVRLASCGLASGDRNLMTATLPETRP